MATLTLDTHEFITGLKQAGVPESQAVAIAEGFKKVDAEHLVTKQDLRAELAEFKADLYRWLLLMLVGQVAAFAAIVKWL